MPQQEGHPERWELLQRQRDIKHHNVLCSENANRLKLGWRGEEKERENSGYEKMKELLLLLFSCSVMSESLRPHRLARQAPLSMGFSRQEYWSGLPFPSPGDLPNPGIKCKTLAYPALAGGFFTTSTTWEALGNRLQLLLLLSRFSRVRLSVTP